MTGIMVRLSADTVEAMLSSIMSNMAGNTAFGVRLTTSILTLVFTEKRAWLSILIFILIRFYQFRVQDKHSGVECGISFDLEGCAPFAACRVGWIKAYGGLAT